MGRRGTNFITTSCACRTAAEIPLNKVRSMVGLYSHLRRGNARAGPVEAPAVNFTRALKWYLCHRPDLAKLVSRWEETGEGERHLLSLLRGHRMKCILRRALDETEFLSDHGVRALSKVHEKESIPPHQCGGADVRRGGSYWPAESQGGLFGGNSNWRGPIWLPMNYLLIESLQKFHYYYGDDFKIECPTGSGKFMTIIGGGATSSPTV